MSQDLTQLSSADVPAAAELAVEHHRAGRLGDARLLYEAILAVEPRHVRAAHNLGAMHLQEKRPGLGLPLLATAADAEPPEGHAWVTYAHALIGSGQLDVAATLLATRAAAAPPPALELRLRLAQGAKLVAEDNLAAAESQIRRALEISPEDPGANADLGLILFKLGRTSDAISRLERAAQLTSGDPVVLVNLGSALRALRRHDEAEAQYRAALVKDPQNAAAIHNLGILLVELDRHAEALACADTALAAQPNHVEALMLRGNALYGLTRYDEALEAYAQIPAQQSARYAALIKIGRSQAALRRYPEALAALEQAIALRPDAAFARYERAYERLLLCDFAGGWQDYEQRWRHEPFWHFGAGIVSGQVRQGLDLDLDAADLAGRKVLLVAEQGIGDQVMFASMIPDLAATAGEVVCVCDSRLVGLFSRSFPGVMFLDPSAAVSLSAFDKVVAMGSLGRLYRNRLEDFPATPFLVPAAEVRASWAERLGPKPAGLRIGISWRGGTPATRRTERSIPLSQFAPMLALPDCEFVSLQYGETRAELEAVNVGLARPIRVFPTAEIDDFEDLAGLLTTLDVVVSVQTSVVHLAGAVGTRCLVLVPQNPEWRYTANASTMPWYGSVRILRQSRPNDWDPVIHQAAALLRRGDGPATRD